MTPEGPPKPNVYVFYDYVCPYAYVGKLRADRLVKEFGVNIVWVPWEIYPTTAPAGEPIPGQDHPKEVRGWVQELAAEMGTKLIRPPVHANSNLALRGAEYARDAGPDTFTVYHQRAFEAIWRDGQNIGDAKVIEAVARDAGMDPAAFSDAIRHPAYARRLEDADALATALGIQRVPTFVFGDQRVVGNDRFEPSLRQPLAAFVERLSSLGVDKTSTLEEDAGLERWL